MASSMAFLAAILSIAFFGCGAFFPFGLFLVRL
jgi:hypothetical protein